MFYEILVIVQNIMTKSDFFSIGRTRVF